MKSKEIKKLVENPLPTSLEGYNNPEDVFARHDKNLANNVADFFVFGPRSKLCMNLSLYFQFVYQRSNPDLYGYYEFDLKHFCNLFEWTDNLQRVIDKDSDMYISEHRDQVYRAFDVETEEDIEINKRMLENIERFAKTKIGDAFIRLNFQGILYSNKSFYYEGDKSLLYTGRSITFLEEFMANYKEYRGRATKLSIKYKPNEKFILNNVKNFAYTNLNLLGKLRKTENLDFLHLYISYVLNKLKTAKDFSNIWTLNRRLFAKLLGISSDREPKELNKVIRRKLKRYQELEEVENIKFTLPLSDFVVVMEFVDLRPATKEQRKVAIQQAFRRHFEDELYHNYVRYHANLEDNPITFKEWIAEQKMDIEAKMFSYVAAQRVIYKRKISLKDLTQEDLVRIGISTSLDEKKMVRLEKENKIYPHTYTTN